MTASTPSRRYLTTDQAAEVLQLSPYTVRGHVRAGRLRAMKPPGTRSWRFDPNDLDKFLTRGATRRSQPA